MNYFSLFKYIDPFDFSLKKNDILATDWMEETDTCKNPVFRVLAVGDTTMAIFYMWSPGWPKSDFHYLKVYDTVHQVTDMWLSEVGSVKHGIVWHWDFGHLLDTLETVLCVDGGETYINQEWPCPTCYIPQVEPEYVSCKEQLVAVTEPKMFSAEWNSPRKMLGIKWREHTPILLAGSKMVNVNYPFQFQGVECRVGDSIEVEGYVSIQRDIKGYLYSIIELEGFAPPVIPVSIERPQKSELRIFPNPATETITLRTTGCNLQKVEILDMNGRVLHAAALNGTASFDYNVSQMPSGIYLARVKTSCGVLTEKFAVK